MVDHPTTYPTLKMDFNGRRATNMDFESLNAKNDDANAA